MLSNVWAGDPAVTQPFGCTSLTVEPYWFQAQCHWHCGIDIGLYTGTPLHAARAGRVSQLSYGILGIQVSGRTETDYYVHIDSAAVAHGAQVAQGQLVAYSGAKVPAGGYLTGPHLHFEVNTGALNTPASSIDPIPVLQQAFSGGSGSLGGVFLALTDQQQTDLLAYAKETAEHLDYLFGLFENGPDGAAFDSPPGTPGAWKARIQQKYQALLTAIPGGTGDNSAVLAAIADLKAHPSVVSDPALLTAVQTIEGHFTGK